MKGEKPKSDRDVLRDCWCRWTAIVAVFASGRPPRRRLDPCAYVDLRTELIAVCRSLAQSDGSERRFYAGLEEMITPWPYLRALEHADREVLAGLLRRCREVEQKLSGTKTRRDWPRHWRSAMAIIAGAVVIGGLVWVLLSMANVPALYSLRDSVDTIWLIVKAADNWKKGSAIAVIVVVAAVFIVSRSTRE
jgi:hypothetical protein